MTEPEQLTADTLLTLGFVDVASWVSTETGITYELDGRHAQANGLRLEERNALYAFVQGEEVLYVGKTARTIRKRFAGYCKPAQQQRTNWRCNAKIREAITAGDEIRIFVFNPISHLRYGLFDLNLAAGLEDALIASFDPSWNGREKGQPISEEAEREEADEVAVQPAVAPETLVERPEPDLSAIGNFQIKLGDAYYDQGMINPGVEASKLLGEHGEPIAILFSDGGDPVMSSVNRNANRNGSVRVVGRNAQIAAWFQSHFRKGDVVEALILDRNRILLGAPASAATSHKGQSNEFFYVENGRRADADLYEDDVLGDEEPTPSLHPRSATG